MFRAEVTVTLRPAILDVQGKTVENALHSLGYIGTGHVRIGKYITLDIDVANVGDARRIATEVSERLLSNPVIEDYSVVVHEMEEASQ